MLLQEAWLISSTTVIATAQRPLLGPPDRRKDRRHPDPRHARRCQGRMTDIGARPPNTPSSRLCRS